MRCERCLKVVSAKQYARPTRRLDEVNIKIASVGDQSASHMTTVASVQTYISLSHTTSYLLTDHFSGAGRAICRLCVCEQQLLN